MNAKLTIPKPCHENWDKMTLDEKGRFCAVCSKSVHDFTRNSKSEIVDYISSQNGKVCGRFLSSQIEERQNFVQKNVLKFYDFSQKYFHKNSFIFLMISGFVALIGCNKKTTGDVVVNFNDDSTKCSRDSTKQKITMRKPMLIGEVKMDDSTIIQQKVEEPKPLK